MKINEVHSNEAEKELLGKLAAKHNVALVPLFQEKEEDGLSF